MAMAPGPWFSVGAGCPTGAQAPARAPVAPEGLLSAAPPLGSLLNDIRYLSLSIRTYPPQGGFG
jgi:hypothetical protein